MFKRKIKAFYRRHNDKLVDLFVLVFGPLMFLVVIVAPLLSLFGHSGSWWVVAIAYAIIEFILLLDNFI